MEVWKDIKNYEGLYQISNLGRIKSIFYSNNKILKPSIYKNPGYYYIRLYKNEIRTKKYIHILVAEAFLNHIPNKYKLIVDHKNNNKLDNNVNNLQVITQGDNIRKGVKRKNATSKYKGVSWFKRDSNWKVQISINDKNKHICYCDTEEEANERYLQELNKIKTYEV